ncbi:HPF/RaiA family ribosome-associated protein [Streptomyces macrosporus]|uniref:HPF/RaiA family ribosome-associated protein n=1 Tax=Streptomyces macrosporus TaxID=44032 RepID=A0ABP5X8F5_9ACTN
MKQTRERPVTGVRVEVGGDVPEGAAEYARTKVLTALDTVREPLSETRVKLSQAADPTVPRPAVAQVSVDVDGRLVRAQAAADTMSEAIDLLQDRLMGRLAHARDTARRPHRGRDPGRRRRLPVEERRIVRRTASGPPRRTPVEAVADMEALGHDFHLFTDAESGVDSVVYRAGEVGYRLARTERSMPGLLFSDSPSGVVVEVSGVPAPRMGLAQAMWRLEITGLPFVFFTHSVTGRGNLLHHRLDGHYGLITPAA